MRKAIFGRFPPQRKTRKPAAVHIYYGTALLAAVYTSDHIERHRWINALTLCCVSASKYN